MEKERTYFAVVKEDLVEIMSHILAYFSEWHKLLRFVALMCRAVKGLRDSLACHSSPLDRCSFPVCSTELADAELIFVRWNQMLSFPKEITVLSEENGFLPKGSLLAPLNPILKEGLLRV